MSVEGYLGEVQGPQSDLVMAMSVHAVGCPLRAAMSWPMFGVIACADHGIVRCEKCHACTCLDG